MGKYHCTVDLLFNCFGISCQNYWHFFVFICKTRLIQTSQTGGQWYSDTSPLVFSAVIFHDLLSKKIAKLSLTHQPVKLKKIAQMSLESPFWIENGKTVKRPSIDNNLASLVARQINKKRFQNIQHLHLMNVIHLFLFATVDEEPKIHSAW